MVTSYSVYGCPLCANTHPVGTRCPVIEGEVKAWAREEIRKARLDGISPQAPQAFGEAGSTPAPASITVRDFRVAQQVRDATLAMRAASPVSGGEAVDQCANAENVMDQRRLVAIRADRDNLIKLHDTLLEETEALRVERDVARRERNAARKAHDDLEDEASAERSRNGQSNAALRAERDGLRKERDAAVAALAEAYGALDEIAAAWRSAISGPSLHDSLEWILKRIGRLASKESQDGR